MFIWDLRSLFYIDFSEEGIREFALGIKESSNDSPQRYHAIIYNKVEHGLFLETFRTQLRSLGLSANLESFEDFDSAFHWLKDAG